MPMPERFSQEGEYLYDDQWYAVREGHVFSPEDPSSWTVDPSECAWELIAKCRNCREMTMSHLSAAEVDDLKRRLRDDWPLGVFSYLQWRPEGICPLCARDLDDVRSLLNVRQ